MGKLNRTQDARISNKLIQLGRHVKSCKDCAAARKSMDATMMCSKGAIMTLDAAYHFNDIVKLRIMAHTKHPGAIFACPDLTKHGATYALTAEPCQVVAIQGGLF